MKKTIIILFIFLVFTAFQAHAENIWTVDYSDNNPPQNATINTQYCWDMGNYLALYSRDSFVTLNFDMQNLNSSEYQLIITDCGSNLRMTMATPDTDGVFSPLNIAVNGKLIAQNIDINWLNYQTNSYPLSGLLNTGQNTITLTLAPNSNSRYYLLKLSLWGN